MNYKLCKQLKESGYPQPKNGQLVEGVLWEEEDNYVPRLEELIEWCGDSFWFLEHNPNGKWEAHGKDTDNLSEFFLGITPSIAVAKLGLKLHEKHISTRPQN